MRIAIVHDWLTGMRGGEWVLEAICSIFPEADIYTLFYFPNSVVKEIEKHKIYTSFLQKVPGIKKFYRYFLPLFPTAIERFNFTGYDLVISSSHCVAKGVITPVTTPHISYVHSPMRYAWDMAWEYFEEKRITGGNRFFVSLFLNYLRMWDVTSTIRCNGLLTNSQFVAGRLKKFLGVKADVIYPPVDTDFFIPGGRDGGYYLIVSALAPYKRLDDAIYGVTKLNRKLVIVGTGQMEKQLKKISGRNVEFTGWVSRSEVLRLMQNCTAFILPGIEDFGIAAVEAQACGKPVIALRGGGALETVVPLESGDTSPTGVFYEVPDPESLCNAIMEFEKNREKFISEKIRLNALRFSRHRFIKEFKEYIFKHLHKKLTDNEKVKDIYA
jgi:glycosyltransferase involved in cell wall biosynthesis